MRPKRQDLNISFFTFRSCRQLDGRHAPCRPLGGATGTHFWKFPYSAYIFEILFFFNIKMKKAQWMWLSCNGLSAEEAQTDLLGSRVALSRTCATNRGLDFFHSVMLISEVDSRSLKGKFFESKLYVEIWEWPPTTRHEQSRLFNMLADSLFQASVS